MNVAAWLAKGEALLAQRGVPEARASAEFLMAEMLGVGRGALHGRGAGEVAPRVIDLERRGDALSGTQHRRYMRAADRCDDRVPVRVTACAGDTLDIVLADSVPPLSYAPCTWPSRAPSRRERWRRE